MTLLTPQHVRPGSVQDELRRLRRREIALQMQLADRSAEALELRRELSAAAAAADPSVVQLRQLMLDPAVARWAPAGTWGHGQGDGVAGRVVAAARRGLGERGSGPLGHKAIGA